MSNTSGSVRWQVKGQYFESCSCDYVCPCPTSGLTARPTKGSCTFAFVHRIDQGRYGGTTLDGLCFALVGHTPGPMADGNWSVGLIADERASEEQRQAITAIASGQAGGPMAALSGLISTFLGVEARPFRFDQDALRRSATIGDLIDQAIEGVPGANRAEPIYLDNVGHPVNSRLALAKAQHSRVHAFGLDWEDNSGRNNGHFAPFDWRST